MKYPSFWIITSVLLIFFVSSSDKPSTTRSRLKPENYQTIVDGKSTALYVLSNKKGMEVCITNFGGRIVSILVPDKKGKWQDVVLGFDSIGGYLRNPSDLGAITGRFTGGVYSRKMNYHPVKNASDTEDDNNQGFQNKVFDAQQLGSSKLVLTYISKDGEEGFQGNLICSITYKLTDDNTLDISMDAGTDRTTLLNLSNHIYFNLSGDPSLPATDEELMIRAKNFLPLSRSAIPTSRTASVAKTPMDFRRLTVIDRNIHEGWSDQLVFGNGFNHYFLLNNNEDINKTCTKLVSFRSGISMKVFSNKPILLFYSGNLLNGSMQGKRKTAYNQHAGIVL